MDMDFVVTWVDGNDPNWQAQMRKTVGGMDAVRFREWDLMRYWFRAVEKFAPSVRFIHFVTWGHLPEWLNTAHPKLRIVRHEEFIPADYLPTFNVIPIELNLHRIPNLAERFVYFNDDMFLGGHTEFFRNGLPCDMVRESLLITKGAMSHAALNNMVILNRRHHKREAMRRHFGKWFSLRYGVSNLLKTASMAAWSEFEGLYDHHCPVPFLRSTYEKLWAEEFEVLDKASHENVRQTNIAATCWLMRYEQLVTGQFAPASLRNWRYFDLADDNIDATCDAVHQQRYAIYCLNDTSNIQDFDAARTKIAAAFEHILPKKSEFEL